ncbi:MAG: helicase C-terminal domain-containing protein, partial [Promethearchaeia archaeon]
SGNEEELPAYDVFPRFVVPEQLEALVTGGQFESLSTKLEGKVDQLLDFLFNAFRAIDSNSWHITLELLNPNWEVSRSNAALAIRPLNSAGLTAPVLVNARSALLMSGTMRPSEHYARLLGITSPDVAEIDSPFPRDSRIILVDKQLTTKYTERNECLWRNIAAKIEATLESVPADKSALVAFPSYRIMNQVLSYDINNRYRGKIKEKRGVRIEAVLDALLDRPHTIFSVYAGRLTEGVDLVDEGSSLLNLIIAVGVPFSPPTSYNLALQEFYNQRFGHGHGYYYSSVLPAIRRVTQLIGRLRRSLRDRGICVLLDNRFVKYSRVLGDDVIADMWPYIGLSELREAIEWFIEGGRNRNE